MTSQQASPGNEQAPLTTAASVARLVLSEPIALLAWLAVSLAATTLVRSNVVASAAIALAGGIAIGLSRVLAGNAAQLRDGGAEAANGAQNVIQSAARWLDRNELLLLIAASPFFLFPLRPFTPVVALVPLLWFGRWLAHGYVTRRSPLNLPVLCLLVMLIPSTVVAADPELSLAKLVGLVFGVGMYAAILNAPAGDTSAKAADALVWIALMVGLAALVGTDWPAVGKLSVYDRIYQLLPRLISELPRSISTTGLINPNEVGGVLAWTLPFVIGLWLAGRRVVRRRSVTGSMPAPSGAGTFAWQLALGLTLALNAATLFLTQSRSAIGGVTLALLALIGVFQTWFRVLLIVAALAVAVAAVMLGPERVADLILRAGDERLSSVPELTLSGRLTIWEEGIELVRQHAWTGIGLNNFDLVRSSVGVTSAPDLQKRLLIHAHDEFLQAAVDLGVPGLVAFTALLASAFGCLWRLSQQASDRAGGSSRLGPAGEAASGDPKGLPDFHTAVPATGSREPAVQGLAGAILAGLLAHQLFGLVDAIALGAKPGFIFWILLGLSARLFADEMRTA